VPERLTCKAQKSHLKRAVRVDLRCAMGKRSDQRWRRPSAAAPPRAAGTGRPYGLAHRGV